MLDFRLNWVFGFFEINNGLERHLSITYDNNYFIVDSITKTRKAESRFRFNWVFLRFLKFSIDGALIYPSDIITIILLWVLLINLEKQNPEDRHNWTTTPLVFKFASFKKSLTNEAQWMKQININPRLFNPTLKKSLSKT